MGRSLQSDSRCWPSGCLLLAADAEAFFSNLPSSDSSRRGDPYGVFTGRRTPQPYGPGSGRSPKEAVEIVDDDDEESTNDFGATASPTPRLPALRPVHRATSPLTVLSDVTCALLASPARPDSPSPVLEIPPPPRDPDSKYVAGNLLEGVIR